MQPGFGRPSSVHAFRVRLQARPGYADVPPATAPETACGAALLAARYAIPGDGGHRPNRFSRLMLRGVVLDPGRVMDWPARPTSKDTPVRVAVITVNYNTRL